MRNVARLGLGTLAAVVIATSGCAYYNTFYNAKQRFREAEDLKRRADPEREKISSEEERLYSEAFEKAARVVKYHADSKWVDDALLLMGKSSFEKGDYSTALRKFDEILWVFPESKLEAETLLMKGRTFVATKEYAEAVSTLEKASTFGEKRWRDDVTFFLGVVQFEQGRRQEAYEAFAKVAHEHEKSEWFGEAGIRAGDIAREDGDFESAVSFYEKVRTDGRTDVERYLGGIRKGEALLEMEEYKRAGTTFGDVANRSTNEEDEGDALLLRGRALEAQGEIYAAIMLYNDLILRMPRKRAAAEAQYAIAEISDRAGDLEEALAQYDLVKEQGTGHEVWRDASARMTEIKKVLDLQAALAAEDEPERERKRYLLAEQLLEKIGDVDGALAEYASLAQDASGNEWGAKALYAQAWVYEHRLAQPDTAEVILRELTNRYNSTEVDAAARRRFGLPVWQVEEITAPPIQFVHAEGAGASTEEVVVERVEPRQVALPPGVTEAKVWVRIAVADDGSVEDAKVVKSGGPELDAAALEAARSSKFLPRSAGGPSFTVLQYVFGEGGSTKEAIGGDTKETIGEDTTEAIGGDFGTETPDSIVAPVDVAPVDSSDVPEAGRFLDSTIRDRRIDAGED